MYKWKQLNCELGFIKPQSRLLQREWEDRTERFIQFSKQGNQSLCLRPLLK